MDQTTEPGQAQIIQNSNAFARAGYTLSLNGHRILTAALASLTMDESQFPFVVVTQEAIKSLFPQLARHNSFTAQMRKPHKQLQSMSAQLYDDGFANLGSVPVFNRIDLLGGQYFLRFSPDIKSELIELTNRYTRVYVAECKEFTTEYQFRLLHILRSFHFCGGTTIPIEHLRAALSIKDHVYPSASHFLARVINPSIEAINQSTSLSVQATPLKVNRSHKIHAVRFVVRNCHDDGLTSERYALLSELIDFGVANHAANNIARYADPATIREKIAVVKDRAANGALRNPPGLLVNLLTTESGQFNSPHDLHPNWTAAVSSATSIYRALSPDRQDLLNRTFQAWIEDKRMKEYGELFVSQGLEHPFLCQLFAFWYHNVRDQRNVTSIRVASQPKLRVRALRHQPELDLDQATFS